MKELKEENVRMERLNKELQDENDEIFLDNRELKEMLEFEIKEKVESDDVLECLRRKLNGNIKEMQVVMEKNEENVIMLKQDIEESNKNLNRLITENNILKEETDEKKNSLDIKIKENEILKRQTMLMENKAEVNNVKIKAIQNNYFALQLTTVSLIKKLEKRKRRLFCLF